MKTKAVNIFTVSNQAQYRKMVSEIKENINEGWTLKKILEEYNITEYNLKKIRNEESYANVTPRIKKSVLNNIRRISDNPKRTDPYYERRDKSFTLLGGKCKSCGCDNIQMLQMTLDDMSVFPHIKNPSDIFLKAMSDESFDLIKKHGTLLCRKCKCVSKRNDVEHVVHSSHVIPLDENHVEENKTIMTNNVKFHTLLMKFNTQFHDLKATLADILSVFSTDVVVASPSILNDGVAVDPIDKQPVVEKKISVINTDEVKSSIGDTNRAKYAISLHKKGKHVVEIANELGINRRSVYRMFERENYRTY